QPWGANQIVRARGYQALSGTAFDRVHVVGRGQLVATERPLLLAHPQHEAALGFRLGKLDIDIRITQPDAAARGGSAVHGHGVRRGGDDHRVGGRRGRGRPATLEGRLDEHTDVFVDVRPGLDTSAPEKEVVLRPYGRSVV